MNIFQLRALAKRSPLLKTLKSFREQGLWPTLRAVGKGLARSTIVRAAVVSLVVLATLVALFYAVENWRGARAWSQYEKKMKEAGEAIDVQELAPPPVPESLNFAAIPYWEKVFASIRPDHGDEYEGWLGIVRGFEDLELPDADPLETGKRHDLRMVVASIRDGEDARLASSLPASVESMSSREAATEVLAFLRNRDDRYQELKSAALERPHARFPLRYEKGFAMLLPHLSYLKDLAEVASLTTIAEIQAGQKDAAFRDMRFLLGLAEMAKEEPLLISQLVRMSVLKIAIEPLWEGLAAKVWTAPQLERLEGRLEKLDPLSAYSLGIQGERAVEINMIDYLKKTRRAQKVLGRVLETLSLQLLYNFAPDGWFDQNKLRLARYYDDYALPAVDPDERRAVPGKVAEAAEARQQEVFSRNTPYGFVAGEFLTMVPARRFAHHQTRLNLAGVACALERYRLDQGELPDSLDAVKKGYIESLPTDVMTGGSLRYKRNEKEGFLIYSVGWDGVDQGGVAKEDSSEGDWIWRGR